MTKMVCLALLFLCFATIVPAQDTAVRRLHTAPAPLFRDPIYDGAADPTLIYNKQKGEWWMFYTQRRASLQSANVAFCYGTSIGVATSSDHGQTWVYKGAAKLEMEEGLNTFWAPDIIEDGGTYHMFVAYIQGVRNNWGGVARIAHYTAKDLWNWQFDGFITLSSDHVIDPAFYKMPDGKWHIWYKDETRNSNTMTGESNNLKDWTIQDTPAIGGKPHEGPKIFRFQDYYWMITDEWAGLRVYRSRDAVAWERQGMVLDKHGKRPEDSPTGAHADVVVAGSKAYIFYFTHPGRSSHIKATLLPNGTYSYDEKRSSIQVAELVYENGTLKDVRDEPFDFWLP